jgi:hypothetical protein
LNPHEGTESLKKLPGEKGQAMEELTENQRLLKLIEERLKSDQAAVNAGTDEAPGQPGGEPAAPVADEETREEQPGDTASKPPDEMFDGWDEFIRD